MIEKCCSYVQKTDKITFFLKNVTNSQFQQYYGISNAKGTLNTCFCQFIETCKFDMR